MINLPESVQVGQIGENRGESCEPVERVDQAQIEVQVADFFAFADRFYQFFIVSAQVNK